MSGHKYALTSFQKCLHSLFWTISHYLWWKMVLFVAQIKPTAIYKTQTYAFMLVHGGFSQKRQTRVSCPRYGRARPRMTQLQTDVTSSRLCNRGVKVFFLTGDLLTHWSPESWMVVPRCRSHSYKSVRRSLAVWGLYSSRFHENKSADVLKIHWLKHLALKLNLYFFT